MNWETILCIGDSITIGARSYLGYPEYLGFYLQSHTNSKWNVINNATSGYLCIDISRDISIRYSNLTIQNPSIATILIGTNDVKKNTDIELFKISYELLLVKTKLLVPYQNIFLITLPCLAKGVKYPYKFEMNECIPKYNEVIKNLSIEHGVGLINLELSPDCYFDGVHLNESGSKNVAQQILSTILEEKGYENSTVKS